MRRTVVFLDIDGVLNSIAWYERRPPMDEYMAHTVDAFGLPAHMVAHARREVDPEAVTRLMDDADIVDGYKPPDEALREAAHTILSGEWNPPDDDAIERGEYATREGV